jgi:phage protein D
MAQAVLREKAREFLTISGTTVGLPYLRPGVYVEIRGMRAPFDGFYYVAKTVSRLCGRGFTTQFNARRPGMPLPPYNDEEE